jgi:hypothetical protein
MDRTQRVHTADPCNKVAARAKQHTRGFAGVEAIAARQSCQSFVIELKHTFCPPPQP